MTVALSNHSLWPIVALTGAGLIAGASISGALVNYIANKQIQKISQTAQQATARVKLLQSVIQLNSSDPKLITSLTTAPRPEPQTLQILPSVILNRPPIKPVMVVAPPAKPQVASVPPVAAAGASVAIASPITAPDTILVTADMVSAAKKTNKIEGVDGAKLGVLKVNATDVSLKNGGRIKIGDRFPSGERLLSLDPENEQIVTDKRTILVF
jgi:hypothetical protein